MAYKPFCTRYTAYPVVAAFALEASAAFYLAAQTVSGAQSDLGTVMAMPYAMILQTLTIPRVRRLYAERLTRQQVGVTEGSRRLQLVQAGALIGALVLGAGLGAAFNAIAEPTHAATKAAPASQPIKYNALKAA